MGVPKKEKGLLKLVHPGGFVEVHRRPVYAAEIMETNPRHLVTRPDVFKYPWLVIKARSLLQPGNVFFVVPNRTIYRLLRAYESLYGTPPDLPLKKNSSSWSDEKSGYERGGYFDGNVYEVVRLPDKKGDRQELKFGNHKTPLLSCFRGYKYNHCLGPPSVPTCLPFRRHRTSEKSFNKACLKEHTDTNDGDYDNDGGIHGSRPWFPSYEPNYHPSSEKSSDESCLKDTTSSPHGSGYNGFMTPTNQVNDRLRPDESKPMPRSCLRKNKSDSSRSRGRRVTFLLPDEEDKKLERRILDQTDERIKGCSSGHCAVVLGQPYRVRAIDC